MSNEKLPYHFLTMDFYTLPSMNLEIFAHREDREHMRAYYIHGSSVKFSTDSIVRAGYAKGGVFLNKECIVKKFDDVIAVFKTFYDCYNFLQMKMSEEIEFPMELDNTNEIIYRVLCEDWEELVRFDLRFDEKMEYEDMKIHPPAAFKKQELSKRLIVGPTSSNMTVNPTGRTCISDVMRNPLDVEQEQVTELFDSQWG